MDIKYNAACGKEVVIGVGGIRSVLEIQEGGGSGLGDWEAKRLM